MEKAEIEVLDLLGKAFAEFIKLPLLHSSDRPEFIAAIHAAQNIVLARDGLRAMRNARLS